MKKGTKRVLSTLLAVFMLIVSVPLGEIFEEVYSNSIFSVTANASYNSTDLIDANEFWNTLQTQASIFNNERNSSWKNDWKNDKDIRDDASKLAYNITEVSCAYSWYDMALFGSKKAFEVYTIGHIFSGMPIGTEYVGSYVITAMSEKALGKAGQQMAEALGQLQNNKAFEPFMKWYAAKCSSQKIVKAKCPVNVEVYDSDGNLYVSIVDDNVVVSPSTISAFVLCGVKYVFLPDDTYNVIITATDNGKLDYEVEEVREGNTIRNVEYNDIPITKDEVLTATVPSEIFCNNEQYNITTSFDDEIECTIDSLPPIQDTLIDVVVAEELFEGFSTELIDKVANAMFNIKSSVDIESYAINTDDTVALFSAIAKYYPSEYSVLVNGDFTYRIICSPERGIITKIRFYYGSDTNLSNYQRRVNELNAEINKLVAQMKGMNEFEKALYLHDYIVLKSEYDLELLDIIETTGILSGELRSERYTEYSILVNGTGVCGSYALAYRAVLNAAGMECLYLSSERMCHAWNLVKIDGNWYHVDCCWDDPVPDTFGRARRTYFLRTDDEIMELQHYSWNPEKYKATSSAFSDMPRDYDITQKYDNGNWYYMYGGKLYKSDIYGNNADEICSLSTNTIDIDNGNIYYANGTSIYKYDVDKGKGVMMYTMSASEAGDSLARATIKNIYVDGNQAEIYKSIYKDSKNKTIKSNVKFTDKYAAITGIEISDTELTLDVFKTKQLKATLISTASTDDIPVTWTSSNSRIATIDENGNVTAKNIGSTTITASFNDIVSECILTVTGDGLSGYCGDDAKWTFDIDTGLLSIFGSGYVSNPNTWESIRDFVISIDIEEGITGIRYGFRNYKSLMNIKIPGSFEDGSFEDQWASPCVSCTHLENIYVEDTNPYYSSEDGVLYNKDKTQLMQYPIGNSRTEYNICDGVKYIWPYAFARCSNLEKIVFPDSILAINDSAFESCTSLTNILIPDSVTGIGICAFGGCSSLTSIIIPNKVTKIFSGTFSECSELTSITIPDSVTEIEMYAFADCYSLTSVIIKDGVTRIGDYAFKNCNSLTSVEIPQSVEDLGLCPFYGCTNLEKIEVNENNAEYTSIDGVLFNKNGSELIMYPIAKKQSSYIIPNTVSIIAESAFSYCSNLKYIKIPDSVYRILDGAFENCLELTEIIIPQRVLWVGNRVFFNCNFMERILVKGPLFNLSSNEFVPISTVIYCRTNSKAESYAKDNGNNFVNIDAVPHEEHDYFLIDYVEKTDTTDGYEKYWCYCGESEYEVIDHNFGEPITITPNCINDGELVKTCTICDYTETETLPATGHDYIKDSTISGNCITNSVTTYKCTKCGDTYTEDGAPEDSHSYVSTVIAPTCTEKGYSMDVCELCGEMALYNFKSPLGHKMNIKRTEATCTEYSKVEYTCSRCDYHEILDDTDSGLAEHRIKTITTDATCTENGKIKEFCSVCGEVFSSETIIAQGHSFGEWITETEPTCDVNGKAYRVCAICEYKEAGEVNALGHNYSTDWTIDKEATCSAEGSKSHHCTNCDSITDVTAIAKKEHTYVPSVTVPTCTSDGYTTHTCSVCGTSYTDSAVSKTGHKDTNDDGYCDICKADLGTHKPTEPTKECDCKCHSKGFTLFVWKIGNFFHKLFKMKKYHQCACGNWHW